MGVWFNPKSLGAPRHLAEFFSTTRRGRAAHSVNARRPHTPRAALLAK